MKICNRFNVLTKYSNIYGPMARNVTIVVYNHKEYSEKLLCGDV